MFKNKSLQVKVVQDDKKEIITETKDNKLFAEKVSIIAEHVQKAVVTVGVVVVAYIALDTVRQCSVEHVKKD